MSSRRTGRKLDDTQHESVLDVFLFVPLDVNLSKDDISHDSSLLTFVFQKDCLTKLCFLIMTN